MVTKSPAMIASARLELERPAPKIVERVDVIGVPMDLGADRRGRRHGTVRRSLRAASRGLAALGIATTLDHGNLAVPVPEAASVADQHAKYLPIILAVCEELAQIVERVVREGGFPIVLGGDHSIAIGTLAGLYRARGRQPGPHLDRRPRRHQHAADLAVGERPRHAARDLARGDTPSRPSAPC